MRSQQSNGNSMQQRQYTVGQVCILVIWALMLLNCSAVKKQGHLHLQLLTTPEAAPVAVVTMQAMTMYTCFAMKMMVMQPMDNLHITSSKSHHLPPFPRTSKAAYKQPYMTQETCYNSTSPEPTWVYPSLTALPWLVSKMATWYTLV